MHRRFVLLALLAACASPALRAEDKTLPRVFFDMTADGKKLGRIVFERPELNFVDGGAQRTIGAHRFALILVHGDLVPDAVGEHDCDETLCVRVGDGHLKLGTQAANLAHAVATGRHLGSTPAYRDPRGRYGRAVAIRDALLGGYDPDRLRAALTGVDADSIAAPTLF